MKYEPFRLERYFAEYEFSIGRQMSCSDCESVSLNTVFDLLDFDEKKEFMNMTLGYTESTGSIKLRKRLRNSTPPTCRKRFLSRRRRVYLPYPQLPP